MGIKEILAKHGVDNAELQADVEGLLTAAESKKTDGIPYSRFKEKVDEANNLRADLAEKEAELGKLKTKITESESELSRLKEIETNYQKTVEAQQAKQAEKWEARKAVFAVEKTDPNYDNIQKIIGKFKLGEELTPEDIETNNNLYDVYDEISYFGKPDPKIKGEPTPIGSPLKTKYKDPFESLGE